MTGSVNQHGEVQAIGGANEKIEGFFDICRSRGLTGNQGVLIPKANVQHLMLRQDVIEACTAKSFFIYPIGTIDEGIALLTGCSAGKKESDGLFTDGSINRLVEDRLKSYAHIRQSFGQSSLSEAREKPAVMERFVDFKRMVLGCRTARPIMLRLPSRHSSPSCSVSTSSACLSKTRAWRILPLCRAFASSARWVAAGIPSTPRNWLKEPDMRRPSSAVFLKGRRRLCRSERGSIS